MNTRRTLVIAAVLTAVFCAFAGGYFIGHSYRQDSYYIVYDKGGRLDPSPVLAASQTDQAVLAEAPETAVPSANGTAETAAASEPVRININTADADELCRLKGIGPALAGRIIEYRTENSGFQFTYEIMNVKGIGEKMYEDLKDYITVY